MSSRVGRIERFEQRVEAGSARVTRRAPGSGRRRERARSSAGRCRRGGRSTRRRGAAMWSTRRRERGEAGGPADDPARAARSRASSGAVAPSLVEDVERVAAVGEEVVAGVEPLRRGEAHVVGVERVRDDEVRAVPSTVGPVRAGRRRRSPSRRGSRRARRRAGACWASRGPCTSRRAPAGEVGEDADGLGEVGPLGVDVDVLVADPAQAVRRRSRGRPSTTRVDHRGVGLQRPGHAEDRQRQAAVGEQAAARARRRPRLPYS